VLIHPPLLNGKVRRQFSADAYSGAALLLAEAREHWVRHVFIAEVTNPISTGIACRQAGRTLIEVARGHFVPKGIVDTTIYEFDSEKINMLRQAQQLWFFDIEPSTGTAVRHECSIYPELNDAQVRRIDTILQVLDLSDGDILEFGVDQSQSVYVIDLQTVSKFRGAVVGGCRVVSTGQCEGELLIWSDSRPDAASTHFIEFAFAAMSNDSQLEPVVVAAERPDITLIGFLMTLQQKGKRVVGMIFRVYSPLCHLSLLLREAGIPAIVVDAFAATGLAPGVWVRIDASTQHARVATIERGSC
jgi:hypothetical protein